jgi:hypothetical protein
VFQELRVQLAVFTRTAAYSTPMPSFIYDELAAIHHPIALRLRDTTMKAIVSLWQRVNLAADDPKRLGLPSRCDQNWFSTTFCGGVNLSHVPHDSNAVYAQVSSFIMYDPLALMLVDNRTLQAFFEPEVKVVNGVEHLIVGVESLDMRDSSAKVASSGMKDMHAIREFLMNAARFSLGKSMEHAMGFRSSSFVE